MIRRDITMSITQQALIAADPARVHAVLADAAAPSALSGDGRAFGLPRIRPGDADPGAGPSA